MGVGVGGDDRLKAYLRLKWEIGGVYINYKVNKLLLLYIYNLASTTIVINLF